jgi:phage tail sheath gpL-like
MWAKILDHSIQENIWPQSHLKTPPAGLTQCAKCQYNRICNSENDDEMARKIQDYFHIGERWSAHKEVETET